MGIEIAATLLGVNATMLTFLIAFRNSFLENTKIRFFTILLLCTFSAVTNIFGMLYQEMIYETSLVSSGIILFLMFWIMISVKND